MPPSSPLAGDGVNRGGQGIIERDFLHAQTSSRTLFQTPIKAKMREMVPESVAKSVLSVPTQGLPSITEGAAGGEGGKKTVYQMLGWDDEDELL